ncbi:hypothetical protein MKW98_027190, partial [Papaver atlanticum]
KRLKKLIKPLILNPKALGGGSEESERKMVYELSEQKKIGIGLVGFGIAFTFLGVLLFFDRGLIALGNLFFLSGVVLLLGVKSTLKLFTNRQNYKGSLSFIVGLYLIFVRWPIAGIVIEIYGVIVLFSGFWPSVKAFLYNIPVVGWFLQYPFLLLDRLRRSFVHQLEVQLVCCGLSVCSQESCDIWRLVITNSIWHESGSTQVQKKMVRGPS